MLYQLGIDASVADVNMADLAMAAQNASTGPQSRHGYCEILGES